MITWIDNERPSFLISRPIVVLPAIADTTAIKQVLIVTQKGSKPLNPLWPVVIHSEIQVGCTAVGLSTIHTYPRKLPLQETLVCTVLLKLPWFEGANVFRLRVLEKRHD